MSNMTDDLTASGLESWLAAPLQNCENPNRLRKCACRCARLTVRQCERPTTDMLDALSVAERLANGDVALEAVLAIREGLERRVQECEEAEVEAQASENEGLEQRLDSLRASAKARSYACILSAFHDDARWGAARAAYEARFSIGLADEIAQLGELWLVVRDVNSQ